MCVCAHARARGWGQLGHPSSPVLSVLTVQVRPRAWGRSGLKQLWGKEPINYTGNESLSAHPVSSLLFRS